MELSDIIIRSIRQNGPFSFHDFMETALYFPGLGYYNSPGEKIGKGGDFFTSPAYTSLFGKMIGKQIAEMIRLSGRQEFTILEFGAGQGLLCYDVLEYLQKERLYGNQVHYCILEKNREFRLKQQQVLSPGINWLYDISEAAPFRGCILANEVLDNFAVHIVKKEHGLLRELYVDYLHGQLVETWQQAPGHLAEYLETLQVDLPEGCRAEINLEATDWLADLAQIIEKAFIIVVDYGDTSNVLYGKAKREGTLLCFYKHSMNDQPLQNIGHQDITAHVNFSALARWSDIYGLRLAGYTSQANFLLSLGFSAYLRKIEQEGKDRCDEQESLRMIQTFFLEMGTKLKVMILQKGFENPRLTGAQFTDTKFKTLRERV